MKQFIIIPAHQSEGMFGYSAIAIEKTQDNLLILKQCLRSLDGARAIDGDINSIVYDNPKLDIELLNDEFEPRIDDLHLKEFTEGDLDIYTEPGDCKVNTPVLTVSTYQFKIQFHSEYSESEVFTDFFIENIINLFE